MSPIGPISKRGHPKWSPTFSICLIHQANYLLDQLLRKLEPRFPRSRRPARAHDPGKISAALKTEPAFYFIGPNRRTLPMPVSLHLSSSPDDAHENILLPWFQAAAEAWRQQKPTVVVAPFPAHAYAMKAFLLERGISFLGIRFVSPAATSAAAFRERRAAPPAPRAFAPSPFHCRGGMHGAASGSRPAGKTDVRGRLSGRKIRGPRAGSFPSGDRSAWRRRLGFFRPGPSGIAPVEARFQKPCRALRI